MRPVLQPATRPGTTPGPGSLTQLQRRYSPARPWPGCAHSGSSSSRARTQGTQGSLQVCVKCGVCRACKGGLQVHAECGVYRGCKGEACRCMRSVVCAGHAREACRCMRSVVCTGDAREACRCMRSVVCVSVPCDVCVTWEVRVRSLRFNVCRRRRGAREPRGVGLGGGM